MCGICGLAGFGLPATGQATIRGMIYCSIAVPMRKKPGWMLNAGVLWDTHDFRSSTWSAEDIRRLIDSQHMQTMPRAVVTGQWPALNWSRYAIYQSVYMLWSLERWMQKWSPAI